MRNQGPSNGSAESRIFLWTILVLAAIYVGLRYAAPLLTKWIGASDHWVPIPVFARVIYMACAVIGALVYVSSDQRRWHQFLGPAVRLLALPQHNIRNPRVLPLWLIPLAVGWFVWLRVMPSGQTPTVVRVQHPTQPDEFAALENPFADLTGEEQESVVREGIVLYQKNCRPCHGTNASGDGPLARGLRLRPVDFTDAGTIATVVESYPFWRIEKGGLGLPDMATPWHSAMPPWGDELKDEDIWRIIMAEYAIAGTEPRQPEGAER
ncbi:MAG: c-type cytochrome [Gemmatimonadales bacterium]